jgi:hypothetical protein
MRSLILACVAVGLAAYGPRAAKTTETEETAAPVSPCAVEISETLTVKPGLSFAVKAEASGDTRDKAVAKLTVTDQAGGAVISFDAPVRMMPVVFEIYDDTTGVTSEKLSAGLKAWITQRQAGRMAKSLPEWKAGDMQPGSGEFPFLPEDGLTREAYEKVRAADGPIFRFVQGLESERVYVLDGAAWKKLGVQTFAG